MQARVLPTVFLFGMPMGLIGAGLNAQHLMTVLDVQHDFSIGIFIYGWASLLIVLYIYLSGLLTSQYRSHLVEEWHEPFKRSFLPGVTLTITLFLMSLVDFFEPGGVIASALFYCVVVVALLHLGLNFFLLGGWLFNGSVTLEHHKPTWFILLSANFVIVIALTSVFETDSIWLQELAQFYYASTLFLWLVFSTTLLYRVIFSHPIEVKFRPSLFIFLAPASLAAVAALTVSGDNQSIAEAGSYSVGVVTWAGVGFATVMLAVWLLSFRTFVESGLSLAAWSYIYPLAAYGLAIQYLAQALQSQWLIYFSVVIFIAMLAFIALLTVWLVKRIPLSPFK